MIMYLVYQIYISISYIQHQYNRPKFEAIVSECDNILNSINQSPSAPSKPAPEFEEFRQYMDQRISTQEALLQRIAQELGLDKPKQQ